eukprot:jgi/Orpsp1_1/1174550/evm.model.c7180000050543.1
MKCFSEEEVYPPCDSTATSTTTDPATTTAPESTSNDKCEDIKTYLKENNLDESNSIECDQGKIINLEIKEGDCVAILNLLNNSSIKKLTLSTTINQSTINQIINISSIEELNLKDIKSSDEIDIKDLNNLLNLNTLYAVIKEEKLEDIAGLTSLEFLEITPNKSEKSYNIEVLKSLKNLKTLHLKGMITKRFGCTLEGNSLEGLDSLTELYIHDHYISQENIDIISKLSNLEILRFDYWGKFYDENNNTLKFDNFKNLKKLTVLEFNEHMEYNSIYLTEIPEIIFSLTNLKTFTMSEEKITKIPDQLANLKNLEY